MLKPATIVSKQNKTKSIAKKRQSQKLQKIGKIGIFVAHQGKLKMNGTRTPRAKNPNDESLIFEIASKDIGKLIGRAGARINELRNQSNCQVIFFKMAASFLPTLPLPLSVD